MAIPYRSALVPAERSEYSQPDTALTKTDLSYYYDGLTPQELKEALHKLLNLGLNAQRAHYADWLRLAADGDVPPGGHFASVIAA
jgi:hypothetical protein